MKTDQMLSDLAGDRHKFQASVGAANDAPLPMVEPYISMMAASAMATAGRIGVFEALSGGPMDVQSLVRLLGASTTGVERLVDFLVAAGHLERDDEMVSNAPDTTRWFTSRGEVDYAPGLAWLVEAWRIMGDLSDAVKSGAPSKLLWDRMAEAPALGGYFANYMRAFADHLASDLLTVADHSAAPLRLLDLGGSHGTHAMAFCRRHPELNAVIVDLDSALGHTEARIAREGLAERISVRRGDIRTCDWGTSFDITLYLSVAHNLTKNENREIFRRLWGSMRPGGQLIIHEYPRETTPALFETAFRLTLLVETGTQTFSYSELDEMLSEAGFSVQRIMVLAPAEKGTLIVARRR